MFTHTTYWWRTSDRLQRLTILVALLLLSLFSVYRSFHYGRGKQTYERHVEFLERRTLFPNPWQYRVLMPALTEVTYKVAGRAYEPLISSVLGTSQERTRYLAYLVHFALWRVVLQVIIFILLYESYRTFIHSDRLLIFGGLWLAFAMGNAIKDSDLSLNTYADVLFYACALLFWVRLAPAWYFVPLMFVATLNRETDMLILAFALFPRPGSWRLDRERVLVMGLAALTAGLVFLGVRAYYGQLPHNDYYVPVGLPMLRLNLFSAMAPYTYMEVLGTVSVLPVVMLLSWRALRPIWRQLFLLIVPVWFLVHLVSVVCWESRLFLVPLVVVFLPAVLDLVMNARTSAAHGE